MLDKFEIIKHLLLNVLKKKGENTVLDIDSKYFIGAFTCNKNVIAIDESKKIQLISINLFELYFRKYFNELIVISSMYIDSKKIKKTALEYEYCAKAYILPISENIILDKKFNFDEEIYDNIYSELECSFRFFHKKTNIDILNLSHIAMGSEILDTRSGFLFFFIPSCNIIIYPHSDIGFGAYSFTPNFNKNEWNSFINNIDEKLFTRISPISPR